MRTYTLLKANLDSLGPVDEWKRIHLDVRAFGRINRAIDLGLFEAVALIEARDAEDAFDLDNNVSREQEHKERVVDFVIRSPLSVGDVLIDNKNGIYQICKPRDWVIISDFKYSMPQIAGRQPILRNKLSVVGE